MASEHKVHPMGREIFNIMNLLHTKMGVTQGGNIVVSILCSLILISIICGIILYAPYMKAKSFGHIDRRTKRLRWSSWHKYLGITGVTWMIVLSVTGLMIVGFSTAYHDYLHGVGVVAKQAIQAMPITTPQG